MTGLLRSKHEATGFFYTKKIGNRWFLVDPDGYLALENDDPNYQGALAWLRQRKGENVTLGDITEQDEEEFMGYVADLS